MPALVLLGLGAGVPLEASGQAPATPETLRPGDRVRVLVWRQPELSGEFAITEQGVIAHPLFRQVSVVNLPLEEVSAAVGRYLSQFEAQPNFVVEPFFRVAVGGEVRQPSVHHLAPGTTVAEAVALAGGFTERSTPHRVTLQRSGFDARLDLRSPATGQRDLTIRSGDQIVVGRSGTPFFRGVFLPAVSVLGSAAAIYRVFVKN